MIVPMEVQRIALRKGYLSPGIVLGWRIAAYLEEFFDGLDLLRVQAAKESDMVFSLRLMVAWRRAAPLLLPRGNPTCDLLVYHPVTGTLLLLTGSERQVELPRHVQLLEPRLAGNDLRARTIYRSAVQSLVDRLLVARVEALCSIEEHRLRRLHPAAARVAKVRCRRCDAQVSFHHLWDLDGVLCCLRCTGLPPEWFDRQ